MQSADLAAIFLQALTLAFMLVGLAGLAIPVFPGIAIIWLAACLYLIFSTLTGSMDGWDWLLFGLISLLAILGSLVDNFILAAKLRETGTPWRSILIGMGAGLVSSFFITPIGALAVTPLALYAAEYLRLRDKAAALRTTKAFLIGWGWSFLALLAIGITMIGLWGIWALKG